MGKKIRAMQPGPLVALFPFVALAVLMAMAFICVKDISGTTLPRNLKFCTHDKCDKLYCVKENKGHGARSLRVISLCCSCYTDVYGIYCVKDISGTTLPRNLKFCTHDKYD